MAKFKDFPLRIIAPTFDSHLINLIIDLDSLRKKTLYGSTKPIIFFQLKHIFHILESIASARIEGNNTAVVDYIETKIDRPKISLETEHREIQNMEGCLEFIDNNVVDSKIDRAFISELHKIVVKDLPIVGSGEGDETPGVYRSKLVSINNSEHITPEPIAVPAYMEELINFIANTDEPKYDLLKTAISHHRFVWIHPFNNGNGRTVRMLTYAMLVKYGFNINEGRILNPAAIFCNDRDDYYSKLALADAGTDKNLLVWCEYVLKGLSDEIEKIDRMLTYGFLQEKILFPALDYARDNAWVTEKEYKILKVAIDKQIITASDLSSAISSKHASDRSRVIRQLRNKKMLTLVAGSQRKYAICFKNNYLLRGIINQLYNEGLVPIN
ncbi:MAG: Fic family protein [FCB group bacterium]|nr:Fic family protein [FCB group bacterium]